MLGDDVAGNLCVSLPNSGACQGVSETCAGYSPPNAAGSSVGRA